MLSREKKKGKIQDAPKMSVILSLGNFQSSFQITGKQITFQHPLKQ